MIPHGLRPDSFVVFVIKGLQYTTTASPLMPRIWSILDIRSIEVLLLISNNILKKKAGGILPLLL